MCKHKKLNINILVTYYYKNSDLSFSLSVGPVAVSAFNLVGISTGKSGKNSCTGRFIRKQIELESL